MKEQHCMLTFPWTVTKRTSILQQNEIKKLELWIVDIITTLSENAS